MQNLKKIMSFQPKKYYENTKENKQTTGKIRTIKIQGKFIIVCHMILRHYIIINHKIPLTFKSLKLLIMYSH